MQEFWVLILIVFLFSTVQSLFGVGLLVFGTPTLLLLGFSFEETIAYLLPSSILISLMQTLGGREHIGHLKHQIWIYSVPCIVIGLALVLSRIFAFDIKLLVGATLILTALTRFNIRFQNALVFVLKRYAKLYLMLMGFLHGISNMGGGLLTIYTTTIYEDKERTRANIAYGYLVFAASQIAVLLVLNPTVFRFECVPLAAVASATYLTVGSSIYVRSSRKVYQQLITAFMVVYGVVLIFV